MAHYFLGFDRYDGILYDFFSKLTHSLNWWRFSDRFLNFDLSLFDRQINQIHFSTKLVFEMKFDQRKALLSY
jgi:hypothetical protein